MRIAMTIFIEAQAGSFSTSNVGLSKIRTSIPSQGNGGISDLTPVDEGPRAQGPDTPAYTASVSPDTSHSQSMGVALDFQTLQPNPTLLHPTRTRGVGAPGSKAGPTHRGPKPEHRRANGRTAIQYSDCKADGRRKARMRAQNHCAFPWLYCAQIGVSADKTLNMAIESSAGGRFNRVTRRVTLPTGERGRGRKCAGGAGADTASTTHSLKKMGRYNHAET